MLIAAAILSGYTYNRKRVLISSVAGAFFCLYIFMPSKNMFIDIAVKIISLMVCSVIAYQRKGKLKNCIVQTLVFAALNILLTGIIITSSVQYKMLYHKNMFFYVDINPVILVTASAVVYIVTTIFSVLKSQFSANELYTADITFRDFELNEIIAFYDSGLKIRDIVSNKDVIITDFEKIKEQLPNSISSDILDFLNEKYSDISTIFIPVFINTVSGSGMLPAIKADKVKINGKEAENILVAFTKNNFSENVAAIFGTGVKKQI